jgi:Fe2+ or Zn2+ uptake regulation protein
VKHARKTKCHLTERLNTTGLRLTPQRQQVYDVLLQKRDHPTAEEVFIRAKQAMPEISHATVYNCLDALVKCGLAGRCSWNAARRASARTCRSIAIFTAMPAARFLTWICRRSAIPAMPLPRGFKAGHYDIAIHGTAAPDCAKKK